MGETLRLLAFVATVLALVVGHTSMALAQEESGNRPPHVGPIVSNFLRPDTIYTVAATDPDEGDELTYEWWYTGIGGCTGFQVHPPGSSVTWGPHDVDPPCVHDAFGGHPITVMVAVTDLCGHRVTRSLTGSLNHVGEEEEARAASFQRVLPAPGGRPPCPQATSSETLMVLDQVENLAADIVITNVSTSSPRRFGETILRGFFLGESGRETTITVSAENRGNLAGSETFDLVIEPGIFGSGFLFEEPRPRAPGAVVLKVPFTLLDAGASAQVEISWTPGREGGYTISAGQQAIIIEVPEFAPAEFPPTFDPIPTEEPPEVDSDEVM